jgi:hypothetical protein
MTGGRAGAARVRLDRALHLAGHNTTHNVRRLSTSCFDTSYQKQPFISFPSTQLKQLSSASFFTINQQDITAHSSPQPPLAVAQEPTKVLSSLHFSSTSF